MSAFRVAVDERCQRGLHLRYEVASVDGDALIDALVARFGERLMTRRESWGPRPVHRAVMPFAFEVRVGTAPGLVSFLHRMSAAQDAREAHRAAFEAVLSSVVQRVAT